MTPTWDFLSSRHLRINHLFKEIAIQTYNLPKMFKLSQINYLFKLFRVLSDVVTACARLAWPRLTVVLLSWSVARACAPPRLRVVTCQLTDKTVPRRFLPVSLKLYIGHGNFSESENLGHSSPLWPRVATLHTHIFEISNFWGPLRRYL